MKITIFHKNSGSFLIEYFIVTFLFLLFVGICNIFIKNVIDVKKSINMDISTYEVNKILDRVVHKMAISDKIQKFNNKLVTDEFELHFTKDNILKVASKNNIAKDFLFSYTEYDLNIEEFKISLYFKIKDKEFKRVLSLK